MVERQILDDGAPVYRGPLGKILRAVELVEGAVGALLLLAILALVMVQITVRFSALGGWAWTGELARFSLVWLTFVMAGYLLGRDQHISFDIIDYVLPERALSVVKIASYVIVAVICAAFVYEGVGLMDAQSFIRSSAAEIPMSFVYLIPTVGFALTGVRALIGIFARKESA
ncbi:MAG TPA: TRAP transporter small permease subunit [Jiangellaceae bacterium]